MHIPLIRKESWRRQSKSARWYTVDIEAQIVGYRGCCARSITRKKRNRNSDLGETICTGTPEKKLDQRLRRSRLTNILSGES